MAMNIKDPSAERLAAEIAAMTGENLTRAVRVSLRERRDRLSLQISGTHRREDLVQFLKREIWPSLPPRVLGRRIPRKKREQILGYGPKGT
jgi:antitoxin VapB